MSFAQWLKVKPEAEDYRVALSVISLINPPDLRERLKAMTRESALAFYRSKLPIRNSDDPFERVIAEALSKNGVPHTRDTHSPVKGESLDFGLPCRVGIEVKRFYCDRTPGVLQKHNNVILVQGQQAVYSFCNLINRGSDLTLRGLNKIEPQYSIEKKERVYEKH